MTEATKFFLLEQILNLLPGKPGRNKKYFIRAAIRDLLDRSIVYSPKVLTSEILSIKDICKPYQRKQIKPELIKLIQSYKSSNETIVKDFINESVFFSSKIIKHLNIELNKLSNSNFNEHLDNSYDFLDTMADDLNESIYNAIQALRQLQKIKKS